jgi:integrase/recombinase XerD
MKLSQAIAGFWLEKKLSFSPNTVANYGYTFREFIDFVGDMDIEQITAIDIRRFLAHLAERPSKRGGKLSKRTVHDAWSPLSSLWTWAETELGIKHIIRGKVKQPDYGKRIIEPLTPEEIKRLVKATTHTRPWTAKQGKQAQTKRPTGDRDKAILLTLVDSGIRISELCALQLQDYDAGRGRLHIKHGKGDKERYAVVGVRTQKAIWRYLLARPDAKPVSPLFASREERPLRRDNLHHLLQQLGENAGVTNVHPHRFRHTFAVTFLRNGGNVMVLKELLGHESLQQVMEYVRIAEQDLAAGARHSPVDNWRI